MVRFCAWLGSCFFLIPQTEASTLIIGIGNSQSFAVGMPKLEFAHRDLDRFIKVFQDVGGVSERNVLTSKDVGFSQFQQLMIRANRLITRNQKLHKVVFYYSGHSDNLGLHLSDRLLSRTELHHFLGKLPAKTKLIFLDSCFSGALTEKGIKRRPAFAIPKAHLDEPSGTVFMAATSGHEYAYEIKELKGSLFTHYLVSGLYGQADANRDGIITIEELYQYTFREMNLYSLALPTANQQRPEVKVNLKGRGSLILAQPNQKTQTLTIAKELYGHILLAQEHGIQMFRMEKSIGELQRIRLIPGRYKVVISNQQFHGTGHVMVAGDSYLSQDDLRLNHDLNLFSLFKGNQLRNQWSVTSGQHQGIRPLTQNGIFVDFHYLTTGMNIRGIRFRPAFGLTLHTNEAYYASGSGTSNGLAALTGIKSLMRLFPDNHRHWIFVHFGLGYQLLFNHWQRPPNREPEDHGSKGFITFGYQFLTLDLGSFAFLLRREGTFIQRQEDTVAFSSTLIGLSYLY